VPEGLVTVDGCLTGGLVDVAVGRLVVLGFELLSSQLTQANIKLDITQRLRILISLSVE